MGRGRPKPRVDGGRVEKRNRPAWEIQVGRSAPLGLMAAFRLFAPAAQPDPITASKGKINGRCVWPPASL
jgi:hypothetical protein